MQDQADHVRAFGRRGHEGEVGAVDGDATADTPPEDRRVLAPVVAEAMQVGPAVEVALGERRAGWQLCHAVIDERAIVGQPRDVVEAREGNRQIEPLTGPGIEQVQDALF